MAQLMFVLGYPFLIYVGLQVAEPRFVSLVLLAAILLRATLSSRRKLATYAWALRFPLFALAAATLASLWVNEARMLLLTPALVSFALLLAFGLSLRGKSVVEEIAQAQTGPLDPSQVAYCRAVTRVWCAFFLLNGLLAAFLALTGMLFEWTLYTGLISYLLMGVVFACEFIYRHWRFRRYDGAPTDVILARIFPPRPS
jgi:uncharacterized membrane protein